MIHQGLMHKPATLVWPENRENGKIGMMVAAGKASSFSRPARRAKARPAERIPVCVPSPMSFVEGPGLGREWWKKALSEKTFSGTKHGNRQENQGVGAKWRTTNLGPFGEVIRITGPMAKANPFRFSSKYEDDESDLLYYGYRYCDPSTGRWVSRDPLLNEPDDVLGSQNPYSFVENNPSDTSDMLGLFELYHWTEASARAYLHAEDKTWRRRGWTFASKLLEFFLSKISRGRDYVLEGTVDDAARISTNPFYRWKMNQVLGGIAVVACGCGGRQSITKAEKGHFDFYFIPGEELFYALGNGHFHYNGTLKTWCGLGTAAWQWSGTVVQKDFYNFRANSPGRLDLAYDAAYYLQSVMHYHRFLDQQKWSDHLAGGAGQPPGLP